MWKSRVLEHHSLSSTVGRSAIGTKGNGSTEEFPSGDGAPARGTSGVEPTRRRERPARRPHRGPAQRLAEVPLGPRGTRCSFWESLKSCGFGTSSSLFLPLWRRHWRSLCPVPLFIMPVTTRQTATDGTELQNVLLPKLIWLGTRFPCAVTRTWTALNIFNSFIFNPPHSRRHHHCRPVCVDGYSWFKTWPGVNYFWCGGSNFRRRHNKDIMIRQLENRSDVSVGRCIACCVNENL